MNRRRSVALAISAVLLSASASAAVAGSPATASPAVAPPAAAQPADAQPAAAAPAAASTTVAAPQAAAAVVGPAGHDFAIDRFSDPWDYTNPEDLLLDGGGPANGFTNARTSGGVLSMHFTTNGYVSPLWGGYGGPLLLGREGGKVGNTLYSQQYHSIAFQAYSDRTVGAGIFWFNCPGGKAAQRCGGGAPITLRAGWHTYVVTPGASYFSGYPLAWGGAVNGLRLAVSPGSAGSGFAIDWFRVFQPGTGATVPWSNPVGGTGDLMWDANTSDADNTSGRSGWGVLAKVSGTSGTMNMAALPAGSFRIGVRASAGAIRWTSVTTVAPYPRFITPNAVGDRDYATTVLHNPWDLNGSDDVARVDHSTNVNYGYGAMGGTNVTDDPYVYLRVGSAGIDTRIYHNLTVTSSYEGPFYLRNVIAMARVMWSPRSGAIGQTDDVLTYSGKRTVSIDMTMPLDTLIEPGTARVPFYSSTPITAFRWDPNEDPGARRWYLWDVQLRSDFATTGTFPITWQDATYQPGGTATIIADNDASGCNGITVASGVPVRAGTNTTNWNTAGVAKGRYWLCLKISRGGGTFGTYARGVLVKQ